MKIDSLKINFIQNNNIYVQSKRSHVSVPHTRYLQNDVFVRSSSAQNISFCGYTFDLKNHRGLPCAYCGDTMLTKRDVDDLVSLKGKKLASRLGMYLGQGRGNISKKHLDAIEFVKLVAKEYPNKTAAEILPIVYVRARNKMILKQAQVYSRIEKLGHSVNSDDLIEYISQIKKQDKPIPSDISIEELSYFLIHKTYIKYRKEVIGTITKFAKEQSNSQNNEVWKRIFYESTTLPSSSNDSDALLVKLVSQALRLDPKGNNDIVSINDDAAAVFYSNLLTEFMPTVEHIKPQSSNGADSSSNFLAVHSHCNGKRSSTPFHEYVLANAEILPNVLNYLYYIKTEDLSRANNINKVEYLQGICKTLKEELAPIADMGDIKDFFASLDDICLADKTSLRAPESRALRLKAAGIFEQKIKSSGSESTLRKELDELYIELLKSFTQNLHKSYSKTIKQLFQEQNVFAALAVRHSMQMDERLKLSKIDSVKVNTMLSDKYKDIYAVPLRAELERLLCTDTNDKYVDFIDKTMHDLFPYDNIGVYCLKVLANCRNENGIYSVDKIYQTLEKDVFD